MQHNRILKYNGVSNLLGVTHGIPLNKCNGIVNVSTTCNCHHHYPDRVSFPISLYRYSPAPFIILTSVSIKAYRASYNVHLSEYDKNLAHQLLSWYYVSENNTTWRAEYNEQHKLDRQ